MFRSALVLKGNKSPLWAPSRLLKDILPIAYPLGSPSDFQEAVKVLDKAKIKSAEHWWQLPQEDKLALVCQEFPKIFVIELDAAVRKGTVSHSRSSLHQLYHSYIPHFLRLDDASV